MGAYLDLWSVSEGHPRARAELERLNRIEEAMECLRENIRIVESGESYSVCRDPWLDMIDEALRDDV